MNYLQQLEKLQRCIRMWRLVMEDAKAEDEGNSPLVEIGKEAASDLLLQDQICKLSERFVPPMGNYIERLNYPDSLQSMFICLDEVEAKIQAELSTLSVNQKKAVEAIIENSFHDGSAKIMCNAFIIYFQSIGEPVDTDFFYRCVNVR